AANTGGLIARVDAADPLPVTVAHLQGVRGVALNGDGTLIATSGNDLYHVDTTGNVSDLGSFCCSLNGVVATAGGAYVSDSSYSQILRYNGSQLTGFASGLSGANKVRLAPDGSLYVANGGNGTVVHYLNGALTTVASSISGVSALAVAADGTVYAGGSSGAFARIGTDGTVSNLGVPELLAQESFGGLVSLGPNQVAAVTSASSGQQGAFYLLNVIPPPAPPPVGSVVFSATAPVASVSGDTVTPVDFGSWTPTLPGDYKLAVTHSAAAGELDNFVHVGPYASGTLTAATTSVPPGNVLVPATLQVTGANYTALSQPEASQLKLIATSLGAAGITSDPSGIIYYTDYSNGLYRLNADGTGTLLVGGFQNCYSVASDAAGKIYFTGTNAATRLSDLVRYDPVTNSQTVLYSSSNSTLSSMDVDAAGNAYLANGTQIYKVAPDGTSSLVIETGAYDPIAFSLDGNGDLFIENDNGTILKLRNDGTLHTIFGTSNGNTTPAFEGPGGGDSGRDVVGDCAGNLLVKSFKWSLIGQISEEHTLAQVIPATGQVGLVIDTSILGLSDIDALSFDRFHNRALLRMDGGAIYSLPFTCGAVSVEAHVVTLPGQQLTGLSVPAAAAIPHTDGSTEYVFTLPNVQDTGFNVGFDAPLTGLVIGQTQTIVGSAFLEFKNTFTGKDYTVPMAVPSVSVAAPAQLSVATDQPQ
ncbi:MAG: hypothetical protein KGL02_13615, partial [Acidobacteriota bacterium]|nr:hypothetical protein [Acidobacteriota bacterium]